MSTRDIHVVVTIIDDHSNAKNLESRSGQAQPYIVIVIGITKKCWTKQALKM